MTGAMYSAVAGLRAHMNALNVIGNNISNVNTNAYKASRYTFLESMYSNVRGGSDGTTIVGGRNPAQNGYGASIGTIDLDMSTKNFTPTGFNGDCMINGNGFFIVGDKNNVISNSSDLKDMLLTRHGDIGFDNQGYLVDGNGKVVYGYLATEKMVQNDDGDWVPQYEGQPHLTAMRLPMTVKQECYVFTDDNGQVFFSADKPTAGGKLKAQDVYGKEKEFTIKTGPEDTTADAIDASEWIHKEVGDCVSPGYRQVPKDPANPDPANDLWEFADATNSDFLSDSRALVDNISIDEKSGRVTATTQSGKVVVCGYIAIAKVDNPNGVSHIDGHYYQALEGAGQVHATSIGHAVQNSHGEYTDANGKVVKKSLGWRPADPTKPDGDGDGVPGEYEGILNSGGTTLITGGLESSGTDLASEISNMILVQRGYQANTRIVTVTDTMLEELVNMKR
ncbi:flagellar hook-basal body complex protein [Oscillospiraceae bacterium 21-37]